ncbi:hypothetical protein ACHAW6_005947 [Cyclotella cf. meneghiniana]
MCFIHCSNSYLRMISRNCKFAIAITLIGAVTIFQDIRLDNLDITPTDDDGLGYKTFSVDKNKLTTYENDVPEPEPTVRSRCQIIYLLGVEGTMHHGILPIVESLAARQIDPLTSTPYNVHSRSKALRYGLFASTGRRFGFHEPPPMDDPRLVKKVVSESARMMEENMSLSRLQVFLVGVNFEFQEEPPPVHGARCHQKKLPNPN